MKQIRIFLIGAFLLTPLAATAETVCPMMAGQMAMAPEAGFSAQSESCCPKGTCDCSIQAPSPMQAQAPQSANLFSLSHTQGLISFDSISTSDATAKKLEASESPPAPDKPYKLTAQYRI